MKEIKLTQGKVAIVDDDVYERENGRKWHAFRGGNGIWYASRKSSFPKQKTILLHREIMNAPPDMQVDHINRNGLDCRRENMRLCSHIENQYNKDTYLNNKSGYKGIRWHKRDKRWQARITVDRKVIHIGYFVTAEEAARAYDEAARKHHGRFAKTNFGGK